MKILWFSHRDFEHPRRGGAERSILEIGRRLVQKGHDVTVVSSSVRGTRADVTREGIRLVRAGSDTYSHLVVPLRIRETRPDVVIDDLGHVVPWCSSLVPGTVGTAFFHHLHARTLPGQVPIEVAAILSWIERQYPKIYRTWPFVTESTSSEEDLITLGIEPRRIVRIPPGVDLETFSPGMKSSGPSLVYFGGFRDYKRPELALKLYERLLRRLPDLQMSMIGDGPAIRRVSEASRRVKSATIHFLGRLNDEQLAKVVSAAWLNVHTSIAEGWGLSILEASACGTPSVAFCVRGVSDALKAGCNGVTVPDGDMEALVQASLDVLHHNQAWQSRCRRFAEGFSWADAVERWETHLENTAESAPGSG
jgi:glycosyltransferase involved in cell wall biosynthesis